MNFEQLKPIVKEALSSAFPQLANSDHDELAYVLESLKEWSDGYSCHPPMGSLATLWEMQKEMARLGLEIAPAFERAIQMWEKTFWEYLIQKGGENV